MFLLAWGKPKEADDLYGAGGCQDKTDIVKNMDVNVSSNHPSCDNTYLVPQDYGGSNKSVEMTWFPCHRQSYTSQVL